MSIIKEYRAIINAKNAEIKKLEKVNKELNDQLSKEKHSKIFNNICESLTLDEKIKEDLKKQLFEIGYQWGRVGVVTDENCPAFVDVIERIEKCLTKQFYNQKLKEIIKEIERLDFGGESGTTAQDTIIDILTKRLKIK